MRQDSPEVTLRLALPEDVNVVFNLIQALAEYAKLSHEVLGTAETLKEHMFGETTYVEAVLAECEGKAVGFALFFRNYSTFLTKPGIYLEDLFVLPEYRRLGIGTQLISYLAKLTVERNYGRLEWTVLDWNESAIAFYQRLGANVLPDWRICRVTGDALTELSGSTPNNQSVTQS